MDMDMELICLIICFLVGTILFYLLRSNCGCNVVEGNTEDDNPDPPSPSTDSSCDHNEYICEDIFNCDNTGIITINGNTTNSYNDLNCDTYCKSEEYIRKKCIVDMDCKGALGEVSFSQYYNNFKCNRYCEFAIDSHTDLTDINIPDSVAYLSVTGILADNTLFSSILSSLKNLKFLLIAVSKEGRSLDVTPLQGLTKLQELVLSGNQITEIEPLRGLTNLQSLDLSFNQITEIEPLRGLTNLQSLDLSLNNASNIAPLQHLTNLQTLYLIGNQIDDITPLQHLTNLQTLYLSKNQIADVTPLQHLTNLQTLDLSNNPISSQNDLDKNETIVSLISNNESLNVIESPLTIIDK